MGIFQGIHLGDLLKYALTVLLIFPSFWHKSTHFLNFQLGTVFFCYAGCLQLGDSNEALLHYHQLSPASFSVLKGLALPMGKRSSLKLISENNISCSIALSVSETFFGSSFTFASSVLLQQKLFVLWIRKSSFFFNGISHCCQQMSH